MTKFHRFTFLVVAAAACAFGDAAGFRPGPRAGRVLVVANAADPVSLEIARHYMATRNLPPPNLLRIPFDNPVNLAPEQLASHLIEPVNARLREIKSPVDFIALMRGVPYRVAGVSVPAALMFRGVGNIQPVHPYYGRETALDGAIPVGGFALQLPTLISGYTLEDTVALIGRSAVLYPSPMAAGTFYLCEGNGPRGSRKPQIDQGLALLRQIGARGEKVAGANLDKRLDVMGQFTGDTRLHLDGNRYLPGSIIDNMTSFGGFLFDAKGHDSLLTFVTHGACGAYGTVAEPTNSWARWPNLTMPARYAAGFTLAESYYQTIQDLKFGVIVGDPLMAPFALPARMQVETSVDARRDGLGAVARIRATEGKAGDGISSIEVWLDDMLAVHKWQPMFAPETSCTMRIKAGDQVLAEKTVRVAVAAEPLGAVLHALAGNVGTIGKVTLGGNHGGKLLFFLAPATDDKGRIVPLQCELAITAADRQPTITMASTAARPLVARCAVIDLGSAAPMPGDRISVTIGRQTRSAQALADDTLEEMVEKMVKYLGDMPPLTQGGTHAVQVRRIPGDPKRFQILLIPKNIGSRDEFPVGVAVRRVGGSQFAAGVEQDNRWQHVAIGGLAEAVVDPRVPVADADFSVEIPRSLLCPGSHWITCVARTPAGAETIAISEFFVAPEKTGAFSARFSGSTFDPGEPLTVYMNHGPALDAAFPKLVVDGMVVCAWPPGVPVAEMALRAPLVSPGTHQVWIEWEQHDGVPPATATRKPLARSARQTIVVRHPMAAGVKINPATITPDVKTVRISGPYLHEAVRVVTERQQLAVSRDRRDPLYWNLDVSRLEPGVHEISILGNAETDLAESADTPISVIRR